METVYINGKYVVQKTTGTQRVAGSIVTALDELLGESSRPQIQWILLCPYSADLPKFTNINVERVGSKSLPLNIWEQIVLPVRSRDKLLVSLSGSAPLNKSRQLCAIHDAAIFDCPDAYTRRFVLSRRFMVRQLMKSGSAIFTVSKFSQDRLAYWLNVPPTTLLLVPNGIDHILAIESDNSTPYEIGIPNNKFLLSVASQNPTKNLRRLIKAFEEWPRSDMSLVLVGGKNTNVFSESYEERKDPRIISTGFVRDGQLKWLYEHAHAFVLPSIYEGFGLTPLEAMACGTPTAVSDIPAFREFCGDAALYFDPLETGSIRDALEKIANSIELRCQLAERGRRQAEKYLWSKSAFELLRCVESLIQ